ncbi:MAG: antibiotic biosynthesis monooxygenase [Bacteroidia bacterium]|nr:antibiotic biosynthesis monooxygenase [Bacteroidia bacterium]
MKPQRIGLYLLMLALSINSFGQESERDSGNEGLMVRLAEIKIDSIYVDEYIVILKEESEASVRLEPGVICIYPMFKKENPTEIRLLEIYANKEAYESHLRTAHFKHYKETTLKMVKSLELIDMEVIDTESMPMIFKKIK